MLESSLRGIGGIQCFLVAAERTYQKGEFFVGSSRDPTESIAMLFDASSRGYGSGLFLIHKDVYIYYFCFDLFRSQCAILRLQRSAGVGVARLVDAVRHVCYKSLMIPTRMWRR